MWQLVNPTTKIAKFHGILTIKRGDPVEISVEVTTFFPLECSS